MAKTSPTQRTLKALKKHGYTTAVVEHWNSFARIRQDLFGFLDVLYLDGKSIVGVQATSRGNVSARIKKIQAEPRAAEWLRSGGRILVWGWGKMASGKYECREVEVTKEMLQ